MAQRADNEILIDPQYNDSGEVYYNLPNARLDKDLIANCPKLAEKVVPVIFLPGVMGTNLRSNAIENRVVWTSDLPVGIDTAAGWVFKSLKERKQMLNPKTTEVDWQGSIISDKREEPRFASRRERGWGSALFKSYGNALNDLQLMLNDDDILLRNLKYGTTQPTARQLLIGENLNAETGESPLTADEVKHSYDFLFPLHVCGYNWLQSNADSAVNLHAYINKVLNMYEGRLAVNKVILVTHSMGGLVARYYSEIFSDNATGKKGRDYILGIVHGVMPDRGSPAAYRRMKIGEQAPGFGDVVGNSAEKLMPVLAQSPGPLQLLPGMAYGTGWLRIEQENGVETYPKANPYEEIYLEEKAWWRLCEKELLLGNTEQEWSAYTQRIQHVVYDFIEGLNGHYHPNTWAFYGYSNKYASDEYLIWKSVRWYPKEVNLSSFRQLAGPGVTTPDKVNIPVPPTQRQDTVLNKQYELLSSGSPGDGTVPAKSGRIAWSGIKSLLAAEVDHEGAYVSRVEMGEEMSVALNFTLRAIVKIVQELPEPGAS
ncbi:hypothetical protein SMC03_003985 [Cronobacter sakazakii]|nr:hypothetical protein [Cronobacter sakazakii]